MARVYVASSWRNQYFPEVVKRLREAGHEVYDFRNPPHGGAGFHWTDIDPNAPDWTYAQYAEGLHHPLAERQFQADIDALTWADTCVLVLKNCNPRLRTRAPIPPRGNTGPFRPLNADSRPSRGKSNPFRPSSVSSVNSCTSSSTASRAVWRSWWKNCNRIGLNINHIGIGLWHRSRMKNSIRP